MSQFEEATGLRDGQAALFASFAAELAPYFQRLKQIGVKVLIWGPGEGTTYYPKRDSIKQYLRQVNPNDEVATSEDLFKSIQHPTEIDRVQLELVHARVANVVFGLVTSDPRQSGIFLEVNELLRFNSLVDKTWLIVPDRRDWKKVGAFIHEPLLKSFPPYRMKEFRTRVLKDCDQVRDFCAEKVAEARGRLMRRCLDEELGSG